MADFQAIGVENSSQIVIKLCYLYYYKLNTNAMSLCQLQSSSHSQAIASSTMSGHTVTLPPADTQVYM